MAGSVLTPGAPASLRRHILWQLLGVVGMFASGIALSIWFSLRAGSQEQQEMLQREATQARVSVVRMLNYYHTMLDNAARDPDLVDLMRLGTVDEQEAWAGSRQRLLPDLLGVALISPEGEVLGDAISLRVGPRCQEDMQRAETLHDLRPLLHREIAGAEHFDLVAVVRETDEVLGGIFVSVRLAQVQRIVDDTLQSGHALVVLDSAGNVIAGGGEAASGRMQEVRQAIPSTGWTVVARAPVRLLTRHGERQVFTGLVTLGAVLLLLGIGMRRLRRAMLTDIVSTRDALTALAHDEPVPKIEPHYVEFEAAAHDINRIALHLQEQRARLEHLSLTDPLTGLPNRRAFETHFQQAQGLAERQHPVALVMLDIDHFKGINDRHGHGVGDRVLLALAQALKDLTRRADLAARLAGDEFAVLLADTDASGLDAWYRRLSDRFRHELDAFGLEIQTGLSAGQTWLAPAAADSIDAALMRADQALYRAKAGGRGHLVQDAEPGPDRAG